MKSEVAALLALASLGMSAPAAVPAAADRAPSAQQGAEALRSAKSLPATAPKTVVGERWIARALRGGDAFAWRYPRRDGWTNARFRRAAAKRRNQARNRSAQR